MPSRSRSDDANLGRMLTVYHYPRCTTCKKALAWLKAHDVQAKLVDIVEEIAGIKCDRNYKLDAPQGVRGRNSDNTQILETYGWAPSTTLADGMAKTYAWVYDEVKRSLG